MTDRQVWLRRISIRDFRNLEHIDLELSRDGAAFIGDNGQGKTNLLEAIHYLQTLRSIRGARDQDVTRFGASGFHVAAQAHCPDEREISVGFDRMLKKKRATRDGVPATRLTAALGSLPSVMFSPRDLELVSGAPVERRRYLDLVLSLVSHRYLNALQNYRSALAQRNSALRDAVRHGGDTAAVRVWDPPLAANGAVLVAERARWMEKAQDEFRVLCDRIGEQSETAMRYRSAFARSADIEADLRDALEEKLDLDVRRGVTHAGPHRDELELTLDGQELRAFGSAGQQRTAAIALRMLESATLREHIGAAPILLLDDPFAELDARRAERILALLAGGGRGQVLLAVPREAEIPPELMKLERMRISCGAITRLAA